MKPGPKTEYDKISRNSDSDVTNAICENISFFLILPKFEAVLW